MSRDGDGKPANPFATPSTGASNPFEDIMGAAPAAAPNPFAGNSPAAPPSAELETPAITVIPAAKPPPSAAPDVPAQSGDAMSMLGLDVEERTPPPSKKAVRPELEEWRSEMAHGATLPPDAPPNLAAASNPRMHALAPPKRAGAVKYVVIAVVVLIVVALGGIAQRVLKGGGSDEALATGAPLSQTDQLLELGIRPENAPDCFTRDKGFQFSYLDSGGKSVVVKSIADVPTLYRMGAKCLPQQ